MSYVIRSVDSPQDLSEIFDILGAQFSRRFTHEDSRFTDLARRFPEDRSLMLVAESGGRIIGGALAFRKENDPQEVILRIIALHPDHRGRGVGRRLVERIEQEAAILGAREIALGVGSAEVAGFYRHLGYHGKSGMWKELPLSAVRRHDVDNRRRLNELRERRKSRLSASSDED